VKIRGFSSKCWSPLERCFSESDYSSSTMISSTTAHTMALLKSYTPNIYPELLRKDYPFEEDEERNTLLDSAFETAKYFVS
jgi:hypothetical protein